MAFWNKSPRTTVLARHTTAGPWFSGEHLLFRVRHGTGRLRMERSRDLSQPDPMRDTFFTLTLGGTPLALLQTSGCPTCQSMLAAGYGLREDCPELRQAADAVAAPFDGPEAALERLAPVTGLLASGYYLLSRVDCYPTDGSGRFFWDVPNGFTLSPATAEIYDPESYAVLPVFPRFLHPSQPTDKYDPSRVEEYRRRIRAGEPLPPALCYATLEYLSILIDGHHRACACALEGVPVPCLILSPARFMGRDGAWQVIWPDGTTRRVTGFPVDPEQGRRRPVRDAPQPPVPGEIFTRRWEPAYRQAVLPFPSALEAGALALYGRIDLTPEGIRALEDPLGSLVPPVILSWFCRQPGADAKGLAMTFSGRDTPPALRKAAFRVLAGIRGDPEIEDLFVAYLVDCDDKDDPLRRIADRYWD